MQILSRVCADFFDKDRNMIFRIGREDLNHYVEPPESIRQDPLFQMLLDDGSIKFPPEDARGKRELEDNPTAGADATGKDIKPKAESKPKAETKSKASVKREVKTEVKAEEKPAVEPADTK